MNPDYCDHPAKFVVKYGKRNFKYNVVQRFFCKRCYLSFSDGVGRKFTMELFEYALERKLAGISFRGIEQEIKNKFNVTVSNTSIYHWLNKDPTEIKSAIEKKNHVIDLQLKLLEMKASKLKSYMAKIEKLKKELNTRLCKLTEDKNNLTVKKIESSRLSVLAELKSHKVK